MSAESSVLRRKHKRQPTVYQLPFFRCPEQDSNLHTVTGTSPSSWRVYQFHHLGRTFLRVQMYKKK